MRSLRIQSCLLIVLSLFLGVSAPAAHRGLVERHVSGDHFGLHVRGDRVEVVASDDAAARVGFRLASVVAPDATTVRFAHPEVRVGAHDVAIDRGSVSELYAIGDRVVEQLFVLDAPPSRRRGTVRLQIEVSTLAPRFEGEDRIAFVNAAGESKLRYGVVRVRDRLGRALPARVSVERGALALRYDDRGATYPVVVDPAMWSVGADLTPLAAAVASQFGAVVAADGDVMVVGAPEFTGSTGANQGAAYVFRRVGSAWTQTAVLAPSTTRAGARFGASVAVDVVGTRVRVVVGAPGDSNGATTTGMAYVFEESGAGTFDQQPLTPSLAGVTTSDEFGASVAIDAGIVVVGAPDHGSNREGGVEVFVAPAFGPFASVTTLTRAGAVASDLFGTSVAVSGTTIAVGAIGVDLPMPPTSDFGAVFIFTTGDQVTWTNSVTVPSPTSITISGASASAHFGSAIAMNGTSLIVGAPGYNRSSFVQAGAAYVYAAGTFVGEAELYPPSAEFVGRFGASVAIDGVLHAVGSPGASVVDTGNGKAFVFTREVNAFTNVQPVSYETASVIDDHFGTGVALAHVGSSTELLAGAPGRTAAGVSNSGAIAVASFGGSLGDVCTDGAECALGLCVDGVCCNNACGGGGTSDCSACSIAAGAASDGICGNRQTSACANSDGGGPVGPRFSDPRAASCSASGPGPLRAPWLGALVLVALVLVRRWAGFAGRRVGE